MNTKFSIIVPIYKVEAYLRQCIDSILMQTYPEFELILVDDGSPDACPAICDEYAEKDSRIIVVHKENGGVTSARLVGAQKVSGDYVCCIDSDDWVHPDYLAKFAHVIEEKQPDIVCCGSIKAIGEKEIFRALPYPEGYYTNEDITRKIYPMLIQNIYAGYFAPAVWGKAFKSDIFVNEQSFIDSRIQMGEDGALTISSVYHATSLYVLSDCLYYYRENLSSLTKSKKSLTWEGPKLIAEHLKNRLNLDEFDFKAQWYRKTVHELFSVVVSQFYRPESYFVICRDINEHLKDPVYADAIRYAKFKKFAGRMASFSLKYRIMWLIKLWSIIKNA